MKIGKYELEDWTYRDYSDNQYRQGYAWYRFAIISSSHLEVCVAIYNWYSHFAWANEYHESIRNENHDSLVWEPSFHCRFKFLQPIYQAAYDKEPLLMMTENCAKVAVDERLERITNLIVFA